MPPPEDNAQVVTTTTPSSSNTSNLLSSNSMNNESTATVIETNSSALGKTPDGKVPSVFENDLIDLEDQNVAENAEVIMIKKEPCDSVQALDEKERKQDCEHATTIQQKEYFTEEQKETTEHKEGTTKEVAESQNVEASEKEIHDDSLTHPEPMSTTQQNTDDHNIEWLKPRVIASPNEMEEVDASLESNGKDNAFKMLKKGAVAAVGGTMVGMGLVMIPLPTPFGAVVASSGLAVLGTEFDQAKELNDRLIDGAKGHLSKARDSMVKGIENMNQDEFDSDTFDDSNTKKLNGEDNSAEVKDTEEAGSVIKINASSSFISDSDDNDNESGDSDDSERGSASESPPVWLHMNPIERNRQARLAKAKYRRDKQTGYEQAKEAFTKKTGKFLSDNLLPLIKKKEPSAVEGEAADIDTSTTAAESKNLNKFLPHKMFPFIKKTKSSDVEEQTDDIDTSTTPAESKRTSKFLPQNMFPFIKKTEQPVIEGQTADIDTSTTVAKIKRTSKFLPQNMFHFMKKTEQPVIEGKTADIHTSTTATDPLAVEGKTNDTDTSTTATDPIDRLFSVEGKTADIDTSIKEGKCDGNSNIIAVIVKGGNTQTNANRTGVSETTNEELYENCKIETNGNTNEGYAVLS